MIKTIKVCDKCQKERDDLIHYIVPFPEEIVAYGGNKNNQKVIIFEPMRQKEIDLCPDCAKEVYLMYSLAMNSGKEIL